MSRRALIYARISVSDDRVPKTANQVAHCQKLATGNDYTVVADPFIDEGISASSGAERPAFNKLLNTVLAGGIDVVLAVSEDRFARNLTDKTALQAACKASGTSWHTVAEGQLDPGTPDGALMSTLRAAFGAYVVSDKGDKQKRANASRRQRGLMLAHGAVPFGYNADRRTLNEAQADLVRTGIKMVNDGQSLYAVVQMFRQSECKPPRSADWTHIGVRSILTAWRNAAVVDHDGQPESDGVWEPIVTRAELEACRTILASRTGERRRASSLMTGLALCGGCGEHMAGHNDARHKRYACTARNRGLHQDKQHTSIDRDTLDRRVRQAVVGYFLAKKDEDSTPNAETEKLADLYSKRDKLKTSKAKLTDVYLTTDTMTKAEYTVKASEIDSQTRTVQDSIDTLVTESASARMQSQTMQILSRRYQADAEGESWTRDELTERLGKAFDELSTDQARDLIRSILVVKVDLGRGVERVDIDLK